MSADFYAGLTLIVASVLAALGVCVAWERDS